MNISALSAFDGAQILLYFMVLLGVAGPLGFYIARVLSGERTFLSPVLLPCEKLFYRFAGTCPDEEMTWPRYATALVVFSACSFAFVYIALRLFGLRPDLTFNTAVSFITNTDWQAYLPERDMPRLAQVGVLCVQNFLSAAVGLAVLAALTRGFLRKTTENIGNFWVDLTRGILYVLLPLSFLLALVLVSQGVVQSFAPLPDATRLQSIRLSSDDAIVAQTIPVGPVASQIAIKQLGTNGGGYYNANAAHPFENPTPLSNFFEMLAILLIPAALCLSFGRMVGNDKQGKALLIAMLALFVPLTLFGIGAEMTTNPTFSGLPLLHNVPCNMEGKETRIGCAASAFWAAATTASSNGSTNAAHDSLMPLAGLVPLVLIQFSDVVFGGLGTGLCAMILFVILTVFITGLMVGRTPELLNKKINAFQIKMVCLAILAPHLAALLGTSAAVLTQAGQAGPLNPFAQGFSEILYAFSSASNNNGSAFAGLQADTPFYNTALALVMLCARYGFIVPVLALAGSLATQKAVPASAGTLDTTSPLFVAVLIGVVILVGILTFVPALALGPIAESFRLFHAG